MNKFFYRNVIVNRVIDGDTIDATIDLGFRTSYSDLFRLIDIDTPERGAPGFKEAKAATEKWCEDNKGKISIWTVKRDKFGRYLSKFMNNDESLNDMLIAEGFAKPYA